jgi:hypothetical protein
MVDSIDGDSIPIALLYHEMCLRRATPPPIIQVYRLELNKADKADRAEKEAVKRTADGKPKDGPPKRAYCKGAPTPRTYEYVNIHALYEGLKDIISQSVGRIVLPSHVGHEMGMLISLIALTGTDFSRNLPQMSGRSVYGWLPDIWPTLVMAYDPAQACLRVETATEQLVGLLYQIKFQRHVASKQLREVLHELQGASIAERTKESLPSYERISCTVRNANWILAYWTCEPAPDPIQHAYGFRQLPGGITEYDDGSLPSC